MTKLHSPCLHVNQLTFVFIYLPASYCHNAIGGVREWTGVYVFYQVAEQESW